MTHSRADTELLSRIPDAVLTACRERMASASFDERTITECEAIMPGQIDRVRLPLVHAVLESRGDATATLTQLFAYGGVVARTRVVDALGDDVMAALEGAQWLVATEGGVRTRVRVMPFCGLWVASDECPVREDPVMGPGATTILLAHALVLDGVSSLLDVGCGAGTLALLARSRGVADVMGVDIDPRALAYGELNARLNGLEITWASGDLTAPAAGRRFDVVVAQPPFVTQPDGVEGTTYLHGGKRGDELTMRLLGEIDGVLGPRGRAWVFFETPENAATVRERVRAALAVPQLDLVLVFGPGHVADRLAVGYASITEPTLDEGYDALVRRYRAHLRSLDIDKTRHVLVHAERSDRARPYTITLEPDSFAGYDGPGLDAVRKVIAVVELPDDELLQCFIRPVPGAWLVHEQALDDEDRRRLKVRFERGRCPEQELSDTSALLLEALRDEGPLAERILVHAEAIEATSPAELEQLTKDVLAFVRRGLVIGMLEADRLPGTSVPR
jgi:SAM-dependent methyltransferase